MLNGRWMQSPRAGLRAHWQDGILAVNQLAKAFCADVFAAPGLGNLVSIWPKASKCNGDRETVSSRLLADRY